MRKPFQLLAVCWLGLAALPAYATPVHIFSKTKPTFIPPSQPPTAAATPTPAPLPLPSLPAKLDPDWVKRGQSELLNGDYFSTIKGAYWVSNASPNAEPALVYMLLHEQAFQTDARTSKSAFPFNLIWGLGRRSTPTALAALRRYQAGKHTHDASGAIGSFLLRQKLKNKDVGLTIREVTKLFVAADRTSKLIERVKAGTPVLILKYNVVNAKQLGFYRDPLHFDRVKLLPHGPEGFLMRAEDNFLPCY